jgi:hypothetical protein
MTSEYYINPRFEVFIFILQRFSLRLQFQIAWPKKEKKK